MSTPTYDWAVRNAHIKSDFVREAIAEFLGTLLLLFFVVGSGLGALIHPDSHAVGVFGVVFGLMVCVLIFGGVSGAHINPAVSIGLAVAGHLKWAKVPLYILVQLLGGYLGSLLAYLLYEDHIENYVKGLAPEWTGSIPEYDLNTGGKIMASFSPAGAGTSLGIGVLTEIILTGILLMAVMSVIDKGNMKVPPHLVAFLLALTVAALAMSHSVVTGTMLNPARDFTPRLAAKTLGWDNKLCFQNINFQGKRQEWWLVGVIAPPLGAILGVLIYNFLVGAQLTNNRDELEPNNNVGGGKGENGDWRNNTMFIPRTGAQPPVHQPPNYNQGQINGHYNPGFAPGDVRQQRY
ncbi:probable glycerol uptake facilitator protein [Folsomia candida]|uniref:Aquaporin-3 n=1 Tax=Folsomia candida TaxID=158441 RepID=A0A226F6B4_FOLCA|nr:probable glycerol uptake facilitator protein [Folsomia candida]OXA64416.1 Aquaporin-3 [Folsomia candida]